ncbi:MAG: aspartate aminotransferase family protein [Armatimonadetes bacterium]|nr:aspartate aminotransferase family protein [Armatimonadota bacterium]
MTPDQLQTEVVRKYTEFVNPYLAKLMNFAGFGVEMEASGCIIRDQDGTEYLDFLGGYGVFSLGHRHPVVIQAVKDQLERMPLSGKTFFNKNQADLAEALAQVTPEGLQFTFFSNSGAEAVEAALKFVKGSTGRSKIVSTHGGYHGKTLGALATTGREKYRKQFEPLMPGVEFVEYGDLDAARAAIDEHTAAFIVETLQGEGGIHVPPHGYLSGLRERTREVGALLIADEVQTGLGRTGKMFGCDHEGVSPDILTMAKALGGGVMPIGATSFTAEIGEKIYKQNPLMHTSTFGGNPLACAAGLATIRVVQDEGLVERSAEMGEKMMLGLREIQARHDLLSEVRGQGLMIGVEFAMDEVGELAIAQMVKRGMIAAYTLNNPRVIRLEPPLIVTEAQIDRALGILDEAVTETEEILAAFA